MRIYDLDYCHSVAPDLLVNGAGNDPISCSGYFIWSSRRIHPL